MKEKLRSIRDAFRMYGVLVQHAKWLSLLSMLMYTVTGLATALNALFMAKLARQLGSMIALDGIVTALVFAIAFIKVAYDVCRTLADWLNVHIRKKIELPLHLEWQQMASAFDCRWHEQASFSEMLELSRAAIDPREIMGILGSVPIAVSTLISCIVTVALLARVQWYLPIAALCLAALAFFVSDWNNKYFDRSLHAGAHDRIVARQLYMTALDQVEHSELRIYGKYEWMISRWKREHLGVQRRILSIKDRFSLTSAGVSIMGTVFCTLMSGLFVAGASTEPPETIVLVITAYSTLQGALSLLIDRLGLIDEYAVQASNYFRLARTPVVKKRGEGANTKPVSIALDGVTFAYDGQQDVLHGITLNIAPSEKIALVGENGSGKTTLAKILLQLYNPKDGTMRMSDEDGEIDYCRACAVLQDYMRYQLSIRDNIALGDISKLDDDEAIREAYRSVCGDKLPFGLDEVAGKEFGARDLSGGEWQRLAIARSFIRQAPLIVLDEPNASIDAFAEAAMIRRMFELAADKTCVFITHRLTTTVLADRIIVMKDGRICEEGSHEELLRLGGEYARMYMVQAELYA